MAVGRARDERTMRNGLVPVTERVLGVVWKDFGTKGCCSDMYCLFVSFFKLYAEKVATRGLCAIAQAESLRYKLLGGLAVRR